MASEERFNIEYQLFDGKKEIDRYHYNNVGSSWLSVEMVRRNVAGDDAEYVRDKSYPLIAQSEARHVVTFQKKPKTDTSNRDALLAVGFFAATLLFCIVLTTNPQWLLGFSAKYFIWIWSLGFVPLVFVTHAASGGTFEPVRYGVYAGLFIFVPVVFYQFGMADFGGLELISGGEGTDATLAEIGAALIEKATQLTQLPTILAAWLPVITAAFLIMGRPNLAKVAGEFKKS